MSDDNTLLIHELCEKLEMNPKTVRFYEDSGVIPKAQRNKSNYRVYTQDDLKRLAFVKKARALGLTIENIKNILSIREEGNYPCHHVINLLDSEIKDLEQKIEEMVSFKAKLEKCVGTFRQHFDKGAEGDICGLIEILFEE